MHINKRADNDATVVEQPHIGVTPTHLANSYSDLLKLVGYSAGTGALAGLGVGGVKLIKDYFNNKALMEAKPDQLEEDDADLLESSLKQSGDETQTGFWGGMFHDLGQGGLYGAALPLAAVLPAMAAYSGTNYLVDVYRKRNLKEKVDQAKQEFEDALKFDEDSPLDANPVNPAVKHASSNIGVEIDNLYYQLKSADFGAKLTGEGLNLPDGYNQSKTEALSAPSGSYKPDTGGIGSSLLGLGGIALGLPLGVGLLAGGILGNANSPEDPDIKRKKALKDLLRRQKALEANTIVPQVQGEKGNLSVVV